MNGKILVDTNILVYLIDKTEEQRHARALLWFKKIEDKENYFIAFQNLKEFSNIAKKKSLLKAEEINEFLEVFSNAFKLIFDNKQDVENANLLAEKTNSSFWDSMIASTMQRHEISKILTENKKDFKKFTKIEVVNPLE